ncbi:unnamed protein product, partial [Thlaspi arvense]
MVTANMSLLGLRAGTAEYFRLLLKPEGGQALQKAEAEVVDMQYVKKKLEEMRSLVDGGMTEEVKVKLEDVMVNLLEKIR